MAIATLVVNVAANPSPSTVVGTLFLFALALLYSKQMAGAAVPHFFVHRPDIPRYDIEQPPAPTSASSATAINKLPDALPHPRAARLWNFLPEWLHGHWNALTSVPPVLPLWRVTERKPDDALVESDGGSTQRLHVPPGQLTELDYEADPLATQEVDPVDEALPPRTTVLDPPPSPQRYSARYACNTSHGDSRSLLH